LIILIGVPPYAPIFILPPLGSGSLFTKDDGSPASIQGLSIESITHPDSVHLPAVDKR
jgi:hypothetical protein